MAEVKTGLEGVLGYFSECGTLGKPFYSALHGSAGTKGVGVGTAVNTGSSMVYIGSGFVNCSGVWKQITATAIAVGSSGSATKFYGIEAGSDGVIDLIAGGTGASVSAAVSARTATTAGQTPLAYVTVGTSGSVLAGSIVDERSFHVPATVSYVTGVDYSLEQNKKDVWNRATFAHYKPGRPAGKLSIKELYTDFGSADVWPASSTFNTVPTIAMTLSIDDVAGTVGETLLFQRCGKDSTALSQPEEDLDSFDISATFGSLVEF
jgi:hypothetical protein